MSTSRPILSLALAVTTSCAIAQTGPFGIRGGSSLAGGAFALIWLVFGPILLIFVTVMCCRHGMEHGWRYAITYRDRAPLFWSGAITLAPFAWGLLEKMLG